MANLLTCFLLSVFVYLVDGEWMSAVITVVWIVSTEKSRRACGKPLRYGGHGRAEPSVLHLPPLHTLPLLAVPA